MPAMNDRETIKQYFTYLYNLTGLSKTDFAKELGVSQPVVSNILTGDRYVPISVLSCIYRCYRIDLSTISSPIEIEYLYNKNKCTNDKNLNNIQNPSDNIIAVPFYEVKAAAGLGERYNDNPDANSLYFDRRWLKNILGVNPNNLAIIQAKGNSMDSGLNQSDDIKDGDLLIIDTTQKEGNNKIFVFKSAEGLRVKKLRWNINGDVEIISNNPKYPTEYVKNKTFDFPFQEIVGRVIWNGSKENV